MNELVGKCEIANGIIVFVTIEIVTIVGECLAQTMTVIEHRGDSIKAESIEMIFAEPIFAVAQKKVQHLVLTIIKAQAVPCRMLPTLTWIEILVRVASKIAQTLNLVLHSMRVNYIHDNSHTVLVSCVDEMF